MGTKRSVLTDEKGIPLSVVLDGANRHDIKLLEKTLNNMVKFRPEITDNKPQNLCLDAGYTGAEKIISDKNYILHIRPRGEEKEEKIKNPDFKARRWVVEVTHSFFNRFRKLLVRYEKKPKIIQPSFILPVLSLSGEKSFLFTNNNLRISSKAA